MDNLTKEQRRKNMKAIKSKDTSIEIKLRKELWKEGIRYRKNYSKLPGKPDIAITRYKIAVFCDSEFWHGFDWENSKERIKSNRQYWFHKIERNIQRDLEVNHELAEKGWLVLRFWEEDIKKDLLRCVDKIKSSISSVDHAK
mgnify:FL=1